MTISNEQQQVIALAGCYQAAHLVHEIAWNGLTDIDVMQSSLNSLLKIDANSVLDVFDGVENVNTGLKIMAKHLGERLSKKDLEISGYVITLLHLERKLIRSNNAMSNIQKGIQRAEKQCLHFPIVHENVLASFADIYAKNVSTLNPRIMVNGDNLHLRNSLNANKIRALLLAGIRAAVLWRQVGGNRWKLMFGRGGIVRMAKQLAVID